MAGAVAGTYGQFSPGQAFRNALGFDNSIFGDLYVTGIVNDPNHRTNAVVMNPTDTTLEAGVQLVDSVGNVYKTVDRHGARRTRCTSSTTSSTRTSPPRTRRRAARGG